jgi:hypothetical protein
VFIQDSVGLHHEEGRQGAFYLLYLLACASTNICFTCSQARLSMPHLGFGVELVHVCAPHHHHLAARLVNLPHLSASVLQQQRAVKQVAYSGSSSSSSSAIVIGQKAATEWLLQAQHAAAVGAASHVVQRQRVRCLGWNTAYSSRPYCMVL